MSVTVESSAPTELALADLRPRERVYKSPICRQRPDLETYHGYAIQNFLEVEPGLGTCQDLRDQVDTSAVGHK